MTTEQRAERAERTGFRLPWGGDRRTASPDPSGESDAPLEEPTDASGGTTAAASTSGEATASAGEAAAHAEEPATPWVLAGAVLPAMDTMSEAISGDSSPVRRQDGRARPADHVEWPAEDAARAQAPALAADSQPTTSANGEDATGAPESPAAAGMEETDMTMASEAAAPATIVVPATASAAHGHSPAPAPASPAARPSKFMADLSRAMQVAAQAAREESVAKVSAEAKQRIEEIQQQGASGTTDLRRRADDDVAASREWSKAEIARIKEETDRRISERKLRLEADGEQHAAQIRRRADLVRSAVTGHEAALAAFIEQLMAEEDPARIATLARHMPEAPVLDEVDTEGTAWAAHDEGAAAGDATEMDGDATTRAEAAERAEVTVQAETSPDAEQELMTVLSDEGAAAAEAEALGGLEGGLAAAYLMDRQRLEAQDDEVATEAMARTTLLVIGLSTVAGIAGFKRELSRVEGVHSVGVSAGESGQFIFAVSHTPDVDLTSAITSIETFEATVTGESPDGVIVTAVEPSADD